MVFLPIIPIKRSPSSPLKAELFYTQYIGVNSSGQDTKIEPDKLPDV